MLISDVINKDELSSLVIIELKEFGVKFRKEKKNKVGQEKCCKKIFRMPLSALESTDVVLANGGVAQIPKFVADACQRILEQVETEGLFRKAGSTSRQKDIRISLEAGLPLGRSHHVIDVANVLKLFFRELPEPLLPPAIQEPLLRCLLAGERGIKPLLMTCLLLPTLTVNTLAFFMQFLHTVSLCSDRNKMTIENLAIIFTPGLMPLDDISSIRFTNHLKVVRMLIEKSESIGVLPESIAEKLNHCCMKTPFDADKKKKKRRSGSLTRMFNGLRKFVGAIGSSENLDSTPEQHEPVTPCLNKSAKKRKLTEMSAFSAKKKKDLIALFPDNGGILPNTPFSEKEIKKTRLSLGGRKITKSSSTASSNGSTMERRWSIVGPGWNKKKSTQDDTKESDSLKVPLSPVISMPCIAHTDYRAVDSPEALMEVELPDETKPASEASDYDYVRIPKSEYEAIKERVQAIETRISQEFGSVQGCILRSSSASDLEGSLTGPEKVLNQFEKTIVEAGPISSPRTEQLAKRLSRELKIRRSEDHRVIRSPSARKIGTMRRRSRENVKLARNKTWHIADSKLKQLQANAGDSIGPGISSFYPKSNLKRGRPNTLFTGLHQPNAGSVSSKLEVEKTIDTDNLQQPEEHWTAAELFFKRRSLEIPSKQFVDVTNRTEIDEPDTPAKKQRRSNSNSQSNQTPRYVTTINLDEVKTPMLPPRSPTVRKTSSTVKSQATKASSKLSDNNFPQIAPDTEQQGRASIARLRSQNAGMVLAKAKLFDELGSEPEKPKPPPPRPVNERRKSPSVLINVHSAANATNSYIVPYKNLLTNLPKDKMIDVKMARRKATSKSPGYMHKRQLQQARNSLLQRNAIENIENDSDLACHPNSGRFEVVCRNANSPYRHTPRIKKPLYVNSSRHAAVRTPRGQSSVGVRKTPLKATSGGTRSSPRLKMLQHSDGRFKS